MVKASCNAKFPSPRFGGRASSFSSNYGFYAEIPGLVPKGGEKRRCSHPDKRFEEENSRTESPETAVAEMAVAYQQRVQRLTDDMSRQRCA
jgi:hypothetical protein